VKASPPETLLALHINAYGLPMPVTEHRFSPGRKWRFDFAFPDRMLAVEVEGGVWNRGRHTRGAGFEKDCEKYNHAAALGWRVVRFTPGMIASGEAIRFLAALIQAPAA
jgi:hypothetical protein